MSRPKITEAQFWWTALITIVVTIATCMYQSICHFHSICEELEGQKLTGYHFDDLGVVLNTKDNAYYFHRTGSKFAVLMGDKERIWSTIIKVHRDKYLTILTKEGTSISFKCDDFIKGDKNANFD